MSKAAASSDLYYHGEYSIVENYGVCVYYNQVCELAEGRGFHLVHYLSALTRIG